MKLYRKTDRQAMLPKMRLRPHGCWEWTAARNELGYGITCKGSAHRRSWRMFNRSVIPAGMYVLHRCDNRACVRPSHLYLGTQADNMRDMVHRGRSHSPKPRTRGELNHRSKLTDAQREEIRSQYVNGATRDALAAQYGVCNGTIRNITCRLRSQKGRPHPWNAKIPTEDIGGIVAEYARGGISQAALAKRYGVSQTAMGFIVRGHRVTQQRGIHP